MLVQFLISVIFGSEWVKQAQEVLVYNKILHLYYFVTVHLKNDFDFVLNVEKTLI